MIVRAAVSLALLTLVSLGGTACSSGGGSTPPSSSIPVTVSTADVQKATAIVLASPELARIGGSTPRSVALTGPGSAGTVPDRFLVSIIIKFARPVQFPAGIVVLRSRPEGASPFPLDDAVTTSTYQGLVTSVSVLVDVDTGKVFAFQAGGLP